MDVFQSLKRFIQPKQVCDDNSIFRLHYRVTFAILIGCSALVTARQYVGDPIDCIVEGVPSNVMDSYCWFSSTFIVTSRLNGVVGRDVAHPGLGNAVGEIDEVKHFKYYQWVCFVLAFQAMLFYVPHYIWKNIEQGRLELLTQDINCPIIEDEIKEKRIATLVWFIKHNWNQQNAYVFYFAFCELLNFLNVIGQMYLMNVFLNGDFLNYGINMIMETDGISSMERIFPKMTKCTFYQYGPSGSIKKHDGLCVLAVNIINEKIYFFLWFWFVFLAFVTGLSLICRLFILIVPQIRYYLLRARARMTSIRDIQLILKRSQIGDWFMLQQISQNVHPIVFKEFCELLVQTIYK